MLPHFAVLVSMLLPQIADVKSIVRDQAGTFTVICNDDSVEMKVSAEALRNDNVCGAKASLANYIRQTGRAIYRGTYQGAASDRKFNTTVRLTNDNQVIRGRMMICTATGEAIGTRTFTFLRESTANAQSTFAVDGASELTLSYNADFTDLAGKFTGSTAPNLTLVLDADADASDTCP